MGEQQGVHPMEGGQGRARSWLGEVEGRGSRDGTGQRRWEGQRKLRAGLQRSRRQSERRGWLGEEGEEPVGYNILGWWRADH